jgi:ribosome-associated protein
MIRINSTLSLPDSELEFEYFHGSGPGGQNVNKVATAVQLRFDVRRSRSLPEDVRRRMIKLAGRRLTRDGVLVLAARRFRTQEQNRADAIVRLRELLTHAAVAPKRRKATRPTSGSRERRLKKKRHAAERKSQRSRRHLGEE